MVGAVASNLQGLRHETGRRIVVRHRLPEGPASDLVGDLQCEDPDHLEVLPDFAAAQRISTSDVIARRQVPQRVVRPSSSLWAISRVVHLGWPGLEQRRLGGWILIASGGFTRRANYCLPIGDPGLPLAQAVETAQSYFAERGLPSTFQLVTPLRGSQRGDPAPGLAALLADRGYTPDTGTSTMVTDLRRPGRPTDFDGDRSRVQWSLTPTPDWMSLSEYGRSALAPAALDVLTAARHQQFGTLVVDDQPVAVVRLAIANGWAGLTALRVDPAHRRRGHARVLLDQGLAAARQAGATTGYLQVSTDNQPAISLYRRAGFDDHHHYHYWRR